MPIYLLYGEDTFSSRRKLEEIKRRFKNSQGNLNLSILDGENLNFSDLQKETQALPFLSQKRLVIIKNLLLKNKDERVLEAIENFLDKIPETTLLFFYEEGRPEESSLFKKLKKSKSEEFPLLSGEKLRRWIEEEVKEKGGKIEKEAVFLLSEILDSDLFRASSEIEKLILYKAKKEIKKEDLRILIKEEIHPNIFAFVDALGEKKREKANHILNQLLESGENESYLLSMIAYQFRNLLIVSDLQKRGDSLRKSGLHPFVLEKTLSQSKNFKEEKLKEGFEKILETDYKIKKGLISPGLALNLLVWELSQ